MAVWRFRGLGLGVLGVSGFRVRGLRNNPGFRKKGSHGSPLHSFLLIIRIAKQEKQSVGTRLRGLFAGSQFHFCLQDDLRSRFQT